MLDTVLTLLAAKAKAVALVAGTAAVTAGAVGGGTVALQAVSDSSELPTTSVSAPVDAAAATPTVTVGIGQKGRGRGAERRSDTATAVLTGDAAAPVVTFTCDPTKNHGQNVSSFARSLPKGPGRGQQVSAAAKSDCGKTAGTEDEAAEVEVEVAEAPEVEETEGPKPAKAAKAKPAKPAPPVEAAETESTEDEDDAEVEDAAEPAKPAKAPKADKATRGKGSGKG